MDTTTRDKERPKQARPTNDPLSAWKVSESDYPFSGESWEKLSFCLNYAILAPSGHNSQPWSFKLGLQDIRLYADRSRALPVVDPYDRELVMSCGAALFHLRLAIRYFGHADEVFLFPDILDRDLLACVEMGPPRHLQGDEQSMFHSIVQRRTNRHTFSNRPVPDRVLATLHREAATEDARLVIFADEKSRRHAARLVEQADRVQMSNPSFRRELAAWMHSGHSRTCDGLPGYSCGLNELLDFATPAYSLAIRTFDLGKGFAAHDRKLVEGSPVLAVLLTETDTPAAWLAAGQALARVLLLAQAYGLSASFLNQPIEVEGLRPQFRETLNLPGFPQILLRLGYGRECQPTPRRDVRDVLL